VLGHPRCAQSAPRGAGQAAAAGSAPPGLWACHLGPELGGQGYGQVKLGLINEILGGACSGPVGVRLPGARFGQCRDPRALRHARTEEEVPEPLLNNEIVSCFAMTEPQGGADPGVFTTRAVRDGDDWVINGEKWFASQRPVRRIPDRDGGDRSRCALMQRMSMFIVPANAPGWRSCATTARPPKRSPITAT
jgi:acyl-CoA dehydrogenase